MSGYSRPKPRTAAALASTLALLTVFAAVAEGRGQPADTEPASRLAARELVQAHAVAGARLFPVAVEDSILAAESDLSTAARVGRWARRFAAAAGVTYLFGPSPGGYVAEGAVVSDKRQDCVSLVYRVSELARADDGRDAVDWALRTRFAGAPIEDVAASDGRVDYDHPAHLDFSLDMIRTGLWGRDVTAELGGAAPDSIGTSRYPRDSFIYVPKTVLQDTELNEGDIVWFVLDPADKSGHRLRTEFGLAIGHIGIVVVDGGQRRLIHAASSGLAGVYAGGTVVTVPLAEYLSRVDKFAGVMVTRFTD